MKDLLLSALSLISYILFYSVETIYRFFGTIIVMGILTPVLYIVIAICQLIIDLIYLFINIIHFIGTAFLTILILFTSSDKLLELCNTYTMNINSLLEVVEDWKDWVINFNVMIGKLLPSILAFDDLLAWYAYYILKVDDYIQVGTMVKAFNCDESDVVLLLNIKYKNKTTTYYVYASEEMCGTESEEFSIAVLENLADDMMYNFNSLNDIYGSDLEIDTHFVVKSLSKLNLSSSTPIYSLSDLYNYLEGQVASDYETDSEDID